MRGGPFYRAIRQLKGPQAAKEPLGQKFRCYREIYALHQHISCKICLVDDKWARPSRFEVARKHMEFGIIQEDLIPLIEGFPGYELVMPLLLPILCNFGIEVSVVSQLF